MSVLSAIADSVSEFESLLERGLLLHQYQVTWGDEASVMSMGHPITQIDWDASRCFIAAHFNEELLAHSAKRMLVEVPSALLPAIDLLWLTYIAPQAREG